MYELFDANNVGKCGFFLCEYLYSHIKLGIFAICKNAAACVRGFLNNKPFTTYNEQSYNRNHTIVKRRLFLPG